MSETVKNFGVTLLIASHALGQKVLAVSKRHPHQSIIAALIMLLLVIPKTDAASSKTQPTALRDRAGAVLPLSANLPQAKLESHGWWRLDHRRTSSAWLVLMYKARRMGWKGYVSSGIRTRAEQAHLHHLFMIGEGAPAFKPDGPSRHLERNVLNNGGWYQAVDVTKPEQLIKLADKLGVTLHQPYGDEPWHIEATQPFYATQLVER